MKYLVISTVISTLSPPTQILDNPANISSRGEVQRGILGAPLHVGETPENPYFSAFAYTS